MSSPVQVARTVGGSSGTGPVPLFAVGHMVAAGNRLLVLVQGSGPVTDVASTPSDTGANTWTALAQGPGMGLFTCVASGSVLNDSFSCSIPGASGGMSFISFEFSGSNGFNLSPIPISGSFASGNLETYTATDLPVATNPVDFIFMILTVEGTVGSNPLVYAFSSSLSSTLLNSVTTVGQWTRIGIAVLNQQLWTYAFPSTSVASDVVTDICLRAGLTTSQIDVSLLTDTYISPNATVPGFLCDRPTPAASLLKVLMEAYFFDACESDGKLKFIPRGLPAAVSIPESDLGLDVDKAKITSAVAQEQDLPRRVTVMFNDPALDYQQNKQEKQRNSRLITTGQQIVKQFPLTMDPSWAAQVAEKILYLQWLERNSFVFNLWRAIYLLLDATDVVQFTYSGLTFQIRIVENSIGQGLAIEIQGVSENPNSYESSKPGAPSFGFVPPVVQVAGATLMYLLDLPLLRDLDSNPDATGFYIGAGSQASGWQGMSLFSSPDDSSYGSPIATSSASITYGFATNTLAAPRSPWAWDNTNTLTVQVKSGSFQSYTQSNVLNGSNGLLVGSEIIQYTTAVDNGDGTVTLSGLLRGQRGTEGACGTHGSNELVLALAVGVLRVQEPLSLVGQLRYYRAVTTGQDITSAASQQFTIGGADLKPYAPCRIGGTVDGSGNITITWVRRTRIGGEADWADGVTDVPLSEDSESYDVEVLNGSTVVRTISALSTPACVYTAAMQTSDFGSTQASVTVNVYQNSAQVGRGFKGTGVAPTPGGWPVPVPAQLPDDQLFYVNGT